MRSKKCRWTKVLFFAYGIWMLWLLFGQRLRYSHTQDFRQYLEQSVNLKPFYTIGNYWYAARRTPDSSLLRHIIINLAGNVLMFIPLGLFLPMNWYGMRSFRPWAGTVICVIVAVELLQMLTMLGSLDVDDVILNLAGAAFGYLIWKIIERQENEYGKDSVY